MRNLAGRHGVSDGPGAGEQRERARRRRKAWIVGGVFTVGMVAGFAMGWREAQHLFAGSEGWPPAMTIAIALSYVIAVVGGGMLLSRQTDEVELQSQYKAVAAAALVYALIYPVWFVLWMGSLAPEPMHGILFIAFWVSLLGAFLFYRFR